MSEAAADQLANNKPSQDFVSDAFAHVKFIGYSKGAMPLLKAAGIAEKIDDGVVQLDAKKDAADFLKQCRKLRFWDRVSAD
jgi:catalase